LLTINNTYTWNSCHVLEATCEKVENDPTIAAISLCSDANHWCAADESAGERERERESERERERERERGWCGADESGDKRERDLLRDSIAALATVGPRTAELPTPGDQLMVHLLSTPRDPRPT
jgi:hypothetical protein